MTSYGKIPTEPKPSAPYVGWGAFLTIAGLPIVLAASTLAGLDGDPKPVVWIGLAVMVAGAALLGLGLNWCLQHIDRSAGVKAGYGEMTSKVSTGSARD